MGRYSKGIFLELKTASGKKLYYALDGNGRVLRMQAIKVYRKSTGLHPMKKQNELGYYPHESLYDYGDEKVGWKKFEKIKIKPYVITLEQWLKMDVMELGELLTSMYGSGLLFHFIT